MMTQPRRPQDPRPAGGPANGQTPATPPRQGRHPVRRSLILRSTSVLPAMFTLLNGLFGFGAMHMASRDALGMAGKSWHNITLACWFIFAAMVCDMLDGRLARWARKTSDFGAQLDSLCDAISFGAAPAFIMLRTVATALPPDSILERVVWAVAAIYVACAVLRLARFNVENEPDESAHLNFRGLPSPGAAASVITIVLLFVHLADFSQGQGWQSDPRVLAAVAIILAVTTLVAALLMVSRFRYPHIVNQYIRGRKPFTYLVKLLVIVIAAFIEPFVTAAAVALVYILSGPAGSLRAAIKNRGQGPTTGT